MAQKVKTEMISTIIFASPLNIIGTTKESRIAIVAHGGVINCILRSLFKMPIAKDFYFKNGDTAIHFIEINEDSRVIHFLNDTSHLAKLIYD